MNAAAVTPTLFSTRIKFLLGFLTEEVNRTKCLRLVRAERWVRREIIAHYFEQTEYREYFADLGVWILEQP